MMGGRGRGGVWGGCPVANDGWRGETRVRERGGILEGAVLWTQQLEWGNGEGVHIPSPPCPRPLISRHGGPWQDLRMPHLGGAGLGSAGWAGLGVRADVAGQGLAPREPLRRRGPLPCRAFWPESTAGTECTNGRRRRARSGSAAGPVAAPASVRTTDRQGARGERRRMGCWRLPSLVRFEPCPTRKPAGPGRAGSVEGRALGRRVLRSRAGSAGLRRRPRGPYTGRRATRTRM